MSCVAAYLANMLVRFGMLFSIRWPMGGGWETYELGGNIVHIHDNSALKPGGGLVAHIFVGEKAHKRKEGITSTQW